MFGFWTTSILFPLTDSRVFKTRERAQKSRGSWIRDARVDEPKQVVETS